MDAMNYMHSWPVNPINRSPREFAERREVPFCLRSSGPLFNLSKKGEHMIAAWTRELYWAWHTVHFLFCVNRMLRAGHRLRVQNLFKSARHRNQPYRLPSTGLTGFSYLGQNTRDMASSATIQAERFLADRSAPLCGLDIAKSFELLRSVLRNLMHSWGLWRHFQPSGKEKKYAHYLGEASWAGARIIQGRS